MNRIEKMIGNSGSMAAGIIFPDLGNCDLELSSSQLEKRTLARKVAELTFLARFGREVTSTLNMEAVITTSAKLMFDNFFFDKIEFDISAPFGAIYTVYSSVDEKSLRSAYLRRGGTKPVINGYKSLGLSVPKSPSRRNGQTHIPLPGDSGRLIVYPAINSVKDRSSLLTGIGEIVFQAVKNAHEHGIVK